MNKSLITLTIAVVAIGGLITFPKLADAYRGDPSVKGPYYSEERHNAMEKAFETNNYEAWKSLMQNKGRVTQVITKENFSKFSQAHKLAEEGKLDEANKIRAELGLGIHNGSGMNQGMGYGGTNR